MKQFKITADNFKNFFFCFDSYERMHYMDDWKSYNHMHSFSEVFFITQGKGVFHTDEEDIPISKGMVVIVNPTVVHTEFSSKDSPLEYAVFSVSDLWFTSDNADSSKKFFVYNFFSNYDFLFDVIRVIEDEDMQKRPFWQSAVLNEFNKFMLFVLRKAKIFSLPFNSSEKPNTISQVHQYLTSRYQEEITLDRLAQIFFLNKYYLAHAYKKKYGISIMKQLNIVRCIEAKNLLQSTNLPISEIAVSVGFNSISHFSGTYKSIINEPPAKTRKAFYEKST